MLQMMERSQYGVGVPISEECMCLNLFLNHIQVNVKWNQKGNRF